MWWRCPPHPFGDRTPVRRSRFLLTAAPAMFSVPKLEPDRRATEDAVMVLLVPETVSRAAAKLIPAALVSRRAPPPVNCVRAPDELPVTVIALFVAVVNVLVPLLKLYVPAVLLVTDIPVQLDAARCALQVDRAARVRGEARAPEFCVTVPQQVRAACRGVTETFTVAPDALDSAPARS